MSSLVLNNKISHSILFPHAPLHPLPIRVFGSTCFMHNFSPSLDKLSPRSHKCVILGFTRSQKVCKCFSPSLRSQKVCKCFSPLNCYFISTEVTLNESSFYFKGFSFDASLSTTVNIPVVCDPPVMHSPPSNSPPPPPLQVYS